MKKLLLFLLFLSILFTFTANSQSCDITFNPETADYVAGETYSVILCFKDYTATGLPENEKATWEDYFVNFTADGTNAVWEALGAGNTFSSSYCIKVTFVAGPVNSISIGAKATGNTNGCVQVESNSYSTVPIELKSFTAENKGDIVNLNWSTLSEINFDYFTVEMSLNGEDFESVTDIKGAGESRDLQDYEFKMSLNEKLKRYPFLYFRLKQTDLDGAYTYSDIITLSTRTDNLLDFGVNNAYYSNNNIHLDIASFIAESLDIKIISITGQNIYNQNYDVTTGMNSINLPISTNYSGIAVIQIANNNKIITKKVFID